MAIIISVSVVLLSTTLFGSYGLGLFYRPTVLHGIPVGFDLQLCRDEDLPRLYGRSPSLRLTARSGTARIRRGGSRLPADGAPSGLAGGRTRLEGTTWYAHNLCPAGYWQVR